MPNTRSIAPAISLFGSRSDGAVNAARTLASATANGASAPGCLQATRVPHGLSFAFA